MARTSAGRSSLSRAVEILDAFDSVSVYLTATQISERTGSPVSSTHRLLGELTSLGLVERAPDRTYRLGARLWEWSARSPGAAGLRAAAWPHLHQVHHVVRQHAQIGILAGHDVLFIERLSAPDAVVNYSVIGQRLPALVSSSGLVQVAWLPEYEQEAILAAGLEPYTPKTVTDPSLIRRHLADIRRNGYVANDGYVHTAVRGIAVPLRGHQDDVLGALSVIVPNDSAPVGPHVTVLKNAAAAISRDYAALTRGRPS
ncbi:IclR family transcriptional regulator [Citricoccus sp. GCM10030269]|uniref:IclR family transcriptional regulator n=1 Tax=Citricoccus sp. GCM10030269 TaxID=3273388 RepID=UPI003611F23E